MIRSDGTLETGGYIEYEVLDDVHISQDGTYTVKLKVIK